MEMTEKKNSLSEMMETSMDKIRQMVDSNTIVGEPITTPDGVTLIPVSRLSYGFGCGGGDYGKNGASSGAGCGAGIRVEPMAFLVVKGGVTYRRWTAVPTAPIGPSRSGIVPMVLRGQCKEPFGRGRRRAATFALVFVRIGIRRWSTV